MNNELMILVLRKYGFPPKMMRMIKRMYENFKLKLEKGKESTIIDYITGVHQGDNLAPLLFVIVFQAAMESLGLTVECKIIIKPTERKINRSKYQIKRKRIHTLDITIR